MKVFVTGVGGQLGYDVMNELAQRGHACVGSDILPQEKIALPFEYVHLDITDQAAVDRVISELQPDAVIYCAAWTAVDAAEDDDKKTRSMPLTWMVLNISLKLAKKQTAKWYILVLITSLTVKVLNHGSQIARSMLL